MSWQGDIPEGFNISTIRVRGVSNHRKCMNFGKCLTKKLKEERFDLVIGFNKMPYLDVYYAADPCYQAKVREQKRFFSRIGLRYRTYVALEKAVFKPEADNHILLISEREKKQFIQYYHTPEHRFHSLQPGISRNLLSGEHTDTIRKDVREECKVGSDEYMLLMVGSSFKTKGLDRSLLALASLPAALKRKTKLVVVGQGNQRPFLKLAKRLGIRDNIIFLGGRNDVPLFLLSADLLLHPAYSENTGTVLLEAMAAGLPVLATDICGYAFYVREAEAGLLIPSPFQQNAFNHFIEHMLTSLKQNTWKNNGPEYITRMQMFDLPERAADLIESIAEKNV